MTIYGNALDFTEDDIDLRCLVAEIFCLYASLGNEDTIPNEDILRDCVYGIYRHSEDIYKRISAGFDKAMSVKLSGGKTNEN